MQSLSSRNLKYMDSFAVVWQDWSIVQEALAQIATLKKDNIL